MIKLIHFFSFFCSSNSSNPIFDIDSKIDLIQFLVWRKKNTPEICRVTALAVLHAALHHPVLRHPVLHPVLRHPVLHHPVLHPLSFADQPAPLVAPLNQLKQQWVSNIYIYIVLYISKDMIRVEALFTIYYLISSKDLTNPFPERNGNY